MKTPVLTALKLIYAYFIFTLRKIDPRKPVYITCHGQADGIGAQTQAILSTMLFASDMRLTYVHTPFQNVSHNVGECADWEGRWEHFLNLGKDELHRNQVGDLNIIKIKNPVYIRSKKETLFALPHCHSYADLFPSHYQALKSKILDKYLSTPKSQYKLHNQPNTISVAVHMRRGDVSKIGENSLRFTDSHYIASLLRRVKKTLSDIGIRPTINLYSEGRFEDFRELVEMNPNFYLDHCALETFHNLVSADVLIMAKSSFSYSAALFSDGIKLYEPFWHQPQRDWITLDKAANFNEWDFKDKIRLRHSAER